jgi:hypothetical protein
MEDSRHKSYLGNNIDEVHIYLNKIENTTTPTACCMLQVDVVRAPFACPSDLP